MTHLIKLELKKFGIAQNIIFMFAAILFSILFITISLWDSMTDPKQVNCWLQEPVQPTFLRSWEDWMIFPQEVWI